MNKSYRINRKKMELMDSRIIPDTDQHTCILMCVSKQKFMEMCHTYPLSALSIEMQSHDRNRTMLKFRKEKKYTDQLLWQKLRAKEDKEEESRALRAKEDKEEKLCVKKEV